MTLHPVALVGAGPGDPELWTVRAVKRLEAADLVLYDALVDVEALRRATDAQCFCVGKRARRDSVPQDVINKLMIRAARRGKRVVRLKGGDPFVFGRGSEEAIALVAAGIPVEVVPGVTTAVAAAELAGIPVTHRGLAAAFLVLAGHTSEAVAQTLAAVAPNSLSIVFMMGLGARAALADQMMARGWGRSTPAAIVCAASTPREWVWTGQLGELAVAAPPDGLAGVLIIGEVVRVRAQIFRLKPEATMGWLEPEVTAVRLKPEATTGWLEPEVTAGQPKPGAVTSRPKPDAAADRPESVASAFRRKANEG